MKHVGADCRGYSVTELMLSLGLVTAISFAFMTAFSDHYKEMRAMSDKVQIQDVARSLQSQLEKNSYCNCLLRGKTFDTTQAPSSWSISLSSIPGSYSAPVPAPPAPCSGVGELVPAVGSPLPGSAVNIQGITLNEINDHGQGNYTGAINIEFDSTNKIRSLRPIKVPVKFSVDLSANTATNRPFLSCGDGLTPAGGGPAFLKSTRTNVPCSGGAGGFTCTKVVPGGPWEQCFITTSNTTYGNAGTYSQCFATKPPMMPWHVAAYAGPNTTIFCEVVCLKAGSL